MEQLIKNYLIENKTIIIPQLGALTLTNEATLEVMFLSYLKFDDGKLTEVYAAKNNCTLEVAKDSIQIWVDKIVSDLNNNQEVYISDLGYFFKNKEGEYDFKSGDNSNVSSESVEILDSEKIEDSNVEDVILTEVIEETVHESDKKVESNQDEVQEVELIENTPEITIDPIVTSIDEPVVDISSIQDNNSEEIIEVIIPTTIINSEKTTILKTDKRRNPLNIFLIILTIVLLIAGILSIFFYEDIKSFLPFSKVEKVEVKTNVSADQNTMEKDLNDMNSSEHGIDENDTTQAKVKSNLDNVKEIEKQEENLEIIDNSKTKNFEKEYYIIVGSFRNELYAERLLSNLKSKGYMAEIIKYSEFNMVSIARFTTLLEARQKNNEIGNSWILKK